MKILANLPTTAITLNDIELLSQWFDPNFARSLAGDEIGKRLVPNLLLSSRREDWEKAAKTLEIVTRIRRSEKKVSVNRTNEKESHTLLDA